MKSIWLREREREREREKQINMQSVVFTNSVSKSTWFLFIVYVT